MARNPRAEREGHDVRAYGGRAMQTGGFRPEVETLTQVCCLAVWFAMVT